MFNALAFSVNRQVAAGAGSTGQCNSSDAEDLLRDKLRIIESGVIQS